MRGAGGDRRGSSSEVFLHELGEWWWIRSGGRVEGIVVLSGAAFKRSFGTLSIPSAHAKGSVAPAAARPAGQLRRSGPASLLHKGGSGAVSDAVGHQPSDQGARGRPRRRTVPTSPSRTRSHRGRKTTARGRARCAGRAAWND